MAVYRRVYDSRYLFVFYYTRQLTRNHCVNLKCKIVNASKINKYSASITVTSCRGSDVCPFLLRDAVLARYLLLSCMCPSVCPSQAGIVSKRLDESSQVLPWGLLSTYPTLCYKEIWLFPQIRVHCKKYPYINGQFFRKIHGTGPYTLQFRLLTERQRSTRNTSDCFPMSFSTRIHTSFFRQPGYAVSTRRLPATGMITRQHPV